VSTALIVGAGPRLGAAIARRLGRDGHDVALIARSAQPLEDLGTALQAEGITVGWATADICDTDALTRAVTRFAEHTGGIDVAVHNVSVWRDATAMQLPAQALLEGVGAGAASLLTLAHAVAPGMIDSGHGTILATGSGAADSPSPGAASLGVQKAALRSVVQALALDLAPQGVHCATVTINGLLGAAGFEPERLAELYGDLVAETDGPPESWRTVVPYPG
jgi:short-subunit dehydrogenase